MLFIFRHRKKIILYIVVLGISLRSQPTLRTSEEANHAATPFSLENDLENIP